MSSDRDHGLNRETFLAALPQALQEDEETWALAQTAARALEARAGEAERISIYPRVDQLDEELLDILAHDFKVDWWDPDYSLEEKRRTLKDSWLVHKRLGTQWAVDTAISAVWPGSRAQPWFEYGGRPYYFRLTVPVPEDGITAQQQRRALKLTRYYKSRRDHLECVEYQMESEGAVRAAAFSSAGLTLEVWPELVTALDIRDRTGAGAFSAGRQTMEIFPGLTERMEVSARGGPAAMTAGRQSVEIFPGLTERLDIQAQSGNAAGTAGKQVVEIFPE